MDRHGKRVASKIPAAPAASELADARARQAAVDEILRVMADAPADVTVVLNAIAREAARLCDAPFARVTVLDGDILRPLAGYAADGVPVPASDVPARRTSIQGRALVERKTLHFADIAPMIDEEFPDARDNARTMGFRAVLAVPLVRGGEALGAMFLYRRTPGLFAPDQVALVETFARQAAIALQSVRQFRAMQDALEQRTATSDILGVISRSPTDVQPVFDTIAENALRLCDGIFSAVHWFDGDLIHVGALRNISSEGDAAFQRAFPARPSRSGALHRAILTGQMVHIPDIGRDPEYGYHDVARQAGFRSVLSIPMLHDTAPTGAVTVYRDIAGDFPEEKIALLRTFADQAVIAVRNVRLFREIEARNRDLTEALEQQTATSDILRVISQSQTDVQPVFDTIVHSVLALCDAAFSGVYLLDGEMFAVAATAGMTPQATAEFRKGYPRKAGPDTVSGRAALECRVVQTDDLMRDPDYAGAPGTFVGARTVLGVPLMRDGRAIGSIGVWRNEVKLFSDTQIALLQTFADQAVIAIENVRLFNELNERTRQLTRSVGELRALGEVGQAVSSTLDLGTVLSTIVSRARALTGVDGGSIYEFDDRQQAFILHSADGLPDEIQDALRRSPMPSGEGALGRMAITGQPVEVRDVVDEQAYKSRVRDRLVKHGLRSLLAVPLLRDDRLLGGLVINRRTPGAFDPQIVELVKTFAAQSAIAIENARLFRELETKSRELEAASRHKSEFLANMSHELRTPLNAIIGFSDVLNERLFGELNAKQAEYVADIAESGRHLLALINDILDLSKIEAGRMELDAADVELPKAVAQTLTLVRERAERRGIALSCAIDDAVGVVRADGRKVKQVLLNLLSNALKFTPEGGRIDVRAVALADRVEVSVADTGVGIAPEDQEAVFEEFRQVGASAARVEGTGLGLAISRKFIELHGGRLWVASVPGKGSTFTFSLPLPSPQVHAC